MANSGDPSSTHEARGSRNSLRMRLGDERALLIGVVHLQALPGSPGCPPDRAAEQMQSMFAAAEQDAKALAQGGADAIVIENFGDAPFFAEQVPAETVAAMALAVESVAQVVDGVPVGVNVMRNDARSALGLCAATQASFLRVNVHVGAMVTDQGLLEGRAAETIRLRASLAPGALLLADVHVKHAAPLAPRPIAESALETIERGAADLVIVSGAGTGEEPSTRELQEVAAAVGRGQVLIGSGLTEANAGELLIHARGAIVGTSIKHDGCLGAAVDPVRVERMRALMDKLA